MSYIRYMIAVLLVAMPTTVWAEVLFGSPEHLAYLESLTPLDADTREGLDTFLNAALYRADCDCYSLLWGDRPATIQLPIHDSTRLMLVEGIDKGWLTPTGDAGVTEVDDLIKQKVF